MIASAVQEYWPDFRHPEYASAQICAESAFDPMAVSPVGARGLLQVMPKTYADILRELRWDESDPFNPERAIRAGVYYQGKARRGWRAGGRTPVQRNDLGLCSYNRGIGNCLSDQVECGSAVLWGAIAVCTARHTTETVVYIERVNSYAPRLCPKDLSWTSSGCLSRSLPEPSPVMSFVRKLLP